MIDIMYLHALQTTTNSFNMCYGITIYETEK